MKQSILLYSSLLLFVFLGCDLFAQTTSTDYFVPTSQTRSDMNPAFRPKQGYIGVPLLSNVYVEANTNTFNLEHLTFVKDGELLAFLHPEVESKEFLSGMSDKNYLSANLACKILSAGFYAGESDNFWTVDFGLRADMGGSVPKDLFAFLKTGFSANDADYASAPIAYNFKDTKVAASVFGEIGVGHSRPFLDNSLLVGAKAKVLLGIASFDLNVDDLKVASTTDQWSVRGKATLQSTLPGIMPKYDDDDDFNGINWDENFGITGFGLGFDIGAVYDLKHLADKATDDRLAEVMKKTKVSMAFTDIGFISWGKSNSAAFETDNINKIIPNLNYDPNTPFYDRLDDIVSDVKNILDLKKGNDKNKGQATALSTNMNIGIEYEVWKNNMTVGLLSATHFGRYKTISELTLSANYNPNRGWFASTFSYSIVRSQFKTFGLAVHLAPGKGMNFFLASDYIIPHVNSSFIPTSSKAINVQFGLAIPIGAVRN